jgi:Ca-activated chloride channel family protein
LEEEMKKLITLTLIILLSMTLSSCWLLSPFGQAGDETPLDNPGYQPYPETNDDDRANEYSYNNSEPAEEAGEVGSADGYIATAPAQKGSSSEGIYEPPVQPIIIPVDEEAPFEDMDYEYYGINPFVDTDEDNLSTFATDVDTGSYTIARSYINQGMLPPADSVRVEEYINFFPQGYQLPSERNTFEIQIDGGPTPFTESDNYNVIRIGIQGYDISERERKDAALTFVIDVSGSMGNGNRLRMVQDSLELLVDQLRPSDTVGIVAYTDTAWVVLPHTSARNKALITEAIYALYPMASTNAEAGLLLGYQEASQAYISGGINRVVLCSDGVANVGATGPDSIWESIQDYASEGINLTSIGVGMGNYNDVLMEQLADQGNGFYAYVDTMEEANRLFSTKLVSTLQVIAFDAKVQVVFNPDVVVRYRLIGFENRAIADEDFRDNTVDAAEIGAGHAVTALYEVKLFNGARGEIATVQLRWQDPDNYRVREISETFETRDLENSFRQTNPYFQLDILVAEFAEILRDSRYAEGTSFWDLLDYAENIADQIERNEVYEFIEMLEEAIYLY